MDEGVRATEELSKLMKNWPALRHDVTLHKIEERTEELWSYYRQMPPIDFVKAFYEAFDEALEEARSTSLLSCGKGCHACCRQNVTIWEGEAAVIADYCKEHGIDIPRSYLEEQMKHEWRDVGRSEAGWCVFLKDGLCSIYSVRPLACRKYLVVSHPDKCDLVKYPPPTNGVSVAVFVAPEVDASAFYGVMADNGKCGRLPELLLPYSK